MPNYYPVMLDVRGRLAIVIGGDRVAAEKAAGLSASGADVHVIAPQFCEELLKQAEHKRVALRYKAYELGDLDGAFVVVAATNDPQLVQAIWNETQERGQLVNIVDVPAYCSFILPSILRREPLTITVSTECTNPSLAKRIRHDLEEIFPPAYGTYLQLAALARGYLRQQGISYDVFGLLFKNFHTSEVLKKLVEGDISQATAITSSLLQRYGIEVPANTLAAGLEEERAYA